MIIEIIMENSIQTQYIKKYVLRKKHLMSRKPEWESCLYAHKYYFSTKYWPHLYTLGPKVIMLVA